MTTDQAAPSGQQDWDCDAYGPTGALCFFTGEIGKRHCPSQAVCLEAMTAERRRVWERLQNRAQDGDPDAVWLAQQFPSPDAVWLAQQFPSPDTLLGGGQAGGQAEVQ
jgi:hypothetical protein